MKQLKFKQARAVNVLCFGQDGIELHFEDYGNVVLVHGTNLDLPATEDDPASNGAGKSTIQEILSIALYGKTVKKPTKNRMAQFLHVGNEENGEVELLLDDVRILRTFRRKAKTQKLEVWKSASHIWDQDSEITKGKSSDETQKWINDYVGLDHHSFCTVCVFDDRSTYSFLEAPSAEIKRQIVESLLGLDKYREYGKAAKELLKESKDAVAALSREYDRLKDDSEACDRRITKIIEQQNQWLTSKKREAKELLDRLARKQEELKNTNEGEELAAYQQAQDRMGGLNESQIELTTKRTRLAQLVEDAKAGLIKSEEIRGALRENVEACAHEVKESQRDLEKSQTLVKKLESLESGATCPTCHSTIQSDNYFNVLSHEKNSVGTYQSKIMAQRQAFEKAKADFGDKEVQIAKLKRGLQEAEAKLSIIDSTLSKNNKEIAALSKLDRPSSGTREKLLEAEIVELKKQLKARKEELDNGSPYVEILEQQKKEKDEKENLILVKEAEVKTAEEEVPYQEYWVKAFGDNGIRKFILEGVIPSLNARIAYWMHYLIDGVLELTFDNTLEEDIKRSGRPAVYSLISNGEQRRINLAISQSFAYVMMLNSGKCPSVVFLDEITGGAIDKAGVVGVYNMIFELAKERQVFVTTHNENLLQMLQGCQTLKLVKQKDVTVLAS